MTESRVAVLVLLFLASIVMLGISVISGWWSLLRTRRVPLDSVSSSDPTEPRVAAIIGIMALLLATVLLASAIAVFMRRPRKDLYYHARVIRCAGCDYDRSGLAQAAPCPECGSPAG